jgi:hypothetical protein
MMCIILTEDDTRGCVKNLDEGETRGCLESLNGNYYFAWSEEAADYVYSTQKGYETVHEDTDSDEEDTDYTEQEDAYHTAHEDSDSDRRMERVIPNLELTMTRCMTRSRLCSWIMRNFGTSVSVKTGAPNALCGPWGKTKCVPKIYSTLRRTSNIPRIGALWRIMTSTLEMKMMCTLTQTTTTLRRMLVTMSLSRRPMVTHLC